MRQYRYKDRIDWTTFLKALTDYVMGMRPLTPVYYQGKKRHYDLLQKTVVLTGGNVPELDMNRPDADPENEIAIVADKIVGKEKHLLYMPQETGFLAVSFVEEIRSKALRGRRALAHKVSQDRLKWLFNGYSMIPR